MSEIADFDALEALIERLEKAPVLSRAEAERLNSTFRKAAIDRMLETGKSYGQASGDLPMYQLSEGEFRSHLRNTDNDLAEQVRITGYGIDRWFDQGEHHPPYFPWRIAVILAKRKELEMERRFLAAYCKHFGSRVGTRDQMIAERARKKGAFV